MDRTDRPDHRKPAGSFGTPRPFNQRSLLWTARRPGGRVALPGPFRRSGRPPTQARPTTTRP